MTGSTIASSPAAQEVEVLITRKLAELLAEPGALVDQTSLAPVSIVEMHNSSLKHASHKLARGERCIGCGEDRCLCRRAG